MSRPTDAHNYCAAVLGWAYSCDPRFILEADIYRVLALDECTRRVLLGCRRSGLLLLKLPKKKKSMRWGRINVGIRQVRTDVLVQAPVERKAPEKAPERCPAQRVDASGFIDRMVALSERKPRARYA